MTEDAAPGRDGRLREVLEGLNPSQRAAVTAPAGPILVFAGAGSGKTRVITRRIAWLVLEEGARPDSILAVTFTNKAAREMRDRVESLSRGAAALEDASRPWVSTFHAFALALLRQFSLAAGLPTGFPVLGASESRLLLRRTARRLGVNDDQIPLRALVSGVSALRNATAAGVEWRGPRLPERRRTVVEVAEAYEEELQALGSVDFDDLQIRALGLLNAHEDARRFLARRARRVLVDEYQDTSPLQHLLLRKLAPHRDVFAVGDDDQSIYSFRGADYRNILRFEEDFPGARVFRLEENYRSTAAILEAANAVIRRNRERAGKTLRAIGDKGAPVRFRAHGSETDEARKIAADILGWGDARGSVAVLVRTRAQTRAFEEAFAVRRIPHFVIGGLRFYERREVLDAIAWVRVGARDRDDDAFRRALGSPARGVGPQSLARIAEAAGLEKVSLLEAARRLSSDRAFGGRPATGLRTFLAAVAAVSKAAELGPEAAVRAAVETSGLGESVAEDPERTENLASLRSAAREWDAANGPREGGDADDAPGSGRARVVAFLDQVSLLAAEDLAPQGGAASGPPPVLIMTVHAAKGLEFDRVFLAGLWEGLFPHSLSLDSHAGIEEERRLFYVGMTRARRELFLSAAPGTMAFRPQGGGVSRFLRDIPGALVEASGQPARPPSARRRPAAVVAGLRRGQRVHHPRFGEGRVESVDPAAGRVTVVFPGWGRKRLVPEYARLRIVR